jgi:amino acid permease
MGKHLLGHRYNRGREMSVAYIIPTIMSMLSLIMNAITIEKAAQAMEFVKSGFCAICAKYEL